MFCWSSLFSPLFSLFSPIIIITPSSIKFSAPFSWEFSFHVCYLVVYRIKGKLLSMKGRKSATVGDVSNPPSSSSSKHFYYLLGKRYEGKGGDVDLKLHCKSLMKFTYRSGFPRMDPYPITGDAGWGCMIRVAQMMMAQILIRDAFGADWRVRNLDECRSNTTYCDILRKFSDYAAPDCPFSIHYMVHLGIRQDKLPGEWFGPSTVALVLRDITDLL